MRNIQTVFSSGNLYSMYRRIIKEEKFLWYDALIKDCLAGRVLSGIQILKTFRDWIPANNLPE